MQRFVLFCFVLFASCFHLVLAQNTPKAVKHGQRTALSLAQDQKSRKEQARKIS
jgi:hypothetical protein